MFNISNVKFGFEISWLDYIIDGMVLWVQCCLVHDITKLGILKSLLSHILVAWLVSCQSRVIFRACVWSKAHSRTDRHGCSSTNIFLFHFYFSEYLL